jgi:hypothetical protein
VVVQFDPSGGVLREIARPAGENAGLRDDAGQVESLDFSKLHHYLQNPEPRRISVIQTTPPDQPLQNSSQLFDSARISIQLIDRFQVHYDGS